VLEALATNRIIGRLGANFLRQTERSMRAETILAEQPQGNDFDRVGAQAGMLPRCSSAPRTRAAMAGNEYGLGEFSIGCMLLTHPERLSTRDTLTID
jgi:hypothetical protein